MDQEKIVTVDGLDQRLSKIVEDVVNSDPFVRQFREAAEKAIEAELERILYGH